MTRRGERRLDLGGDLPELSPLSLAAGRDVNLEGVAEVIATVRRKLVEVREMYDDIYSNVSTLEGLRVMLADGLQQLANCVDDGQLVGEWIDIYNLLSRRRQRRAYGQEYPALRALPLSLADSYRDLSDQIDESERTPESGRSGTFNQTSTPVQPPTVLDPSGRRIVDPYRRPGRTLLREDRLRAAQRSFESDRRAMSPVVQAGEWHQGRGSRYLSRNVIWIDPSQPDGTLSGAYEVEFAHSGTGIVTARNTAPAPITDENVLQRAYETAEFYVRQPARISTTEPLLSVRRREIVDYLFNWNCRRPDRTEGVTRVDEAHAWLVNRSLWYRRFTGGGPDSQDAYGFAVLFDADSHRVMNTVGPIPVLADFDVQLDVLSLLDQAYEAGRTAPQSPTPQGMELNTRATLEFANRETRRREISLKLLEQAAERTGTSIHAGITEVVVDGDAYNLSWSQRRADGGYTRQLSGVVFKPNSDAVFAFRMPGLSFREDAEDAEEGSVSPLYLRRLAAARQWFSSTIGFADVTAATWVVSNNRWSRRYVQGGLETEFHVVFHDGVADVDGWGISPLGDRSGFEYDVEDGSDMGLYDERTAVASEAWERYSDENPVADHDPEWTVHGQGLRWSRHFNGVNGDRRFPMVYTIVFEEGSAAIRDSTAVEILVTGPRRSPPLDGADPLFARRLPFASELFVRQNSMVDAILSGAWEAEDGNVDIWLRRYHFPITTGTATAVFRIEWRPGTVSVSRCERGH